MGKTKQIVKLMNRKFVSTLPFGKKLKNKERCSDSLTKPNNMEQIQLNNSSSSSISSSPCLFTKPSTEQIQLNNRSSSSISSSPCFFTCEICMDTLPVGRKFKSNPKRCSDLHPFCTNCISKYVKVKVEDDGTSEIKCPNTNCNLILDPLSCRPILPPRVFDNWCEVLCKSAVAALVDQGSSSESHVRSAYCPFPECSELILIEGELPSTTRITSSTCPSCKKLLCFECQVPWMKGHRCMSDEKKNDILFSEMVKRKKWAKCPKCNYHVERISGCTLILCRCKTQFCYFCGSKVARNGSCVCRRAMWHDPAYMNFQFPLTVCICCVLGLLSLSGLMISLFV